MEKFEYIFRDTKENEEKYCVEICYGKDKLTDCIRRLAESVAKTIEMDSVHGNSL